MRKEFVKTVVENHFRVICDFCGFAKEDTYSGFGNCAICGKLGCSRCGEFFYNYGSDYHSHYGCKEHVDKIRDAFNERDDFENTVPDIDYFIKKRIVPLP
jgi:hypothetical protein